MEQTSWWREPTRGQWLSFLAAYLGWVLDAFDFMIFVLVMPEIAREFGATQTSTAASITVTLLLRLAGGVVAGAVGDRFGRKLPLMISLLWLAVFDAAVAVAPSFAWIVALRALYGFGMGAEWAAGATLAMENWPPRSRGIASGLLQGGWAVGYFVAAWVSGPVVQAYGWRALFVLAVVPALLVLPIRFFVPESADFRPRAERAPPLRIAFPPELRRRIVWASAVLAFGFGSYYALTTSYPSLLKLQLGLAAQTPRLVMLFNVGMLVGAALCGLLSARRGPVLALVLPSLLMIACLPLYLGAVPGVIAVGAFLGGALGGGISGVTPLLLTTLFPAEVRARAVGLVYQLGSCLAALVPPAVAALHEYGGLPLSRAMAVIVTGCLLAMIATVRNGARLL